MMLATRLAGLLGQVPGGGGAQPPPGVGDKLNTIISWGSYIAFGLAVLGLIISGGLMAVSHRRGQSGEHVAGIGYALAGSVVIAAASGLVAVFAH